MENFNRTSDVRLSSGISTTDATAIKDISIKSPEPTICALLEKIPREIRDNIWRYLFVRPVAIIPEIHTHDYQWESGNEDEKHVHRRFYRKYSHTWAFVTWRYDHSAYGTLREKIAWTTNPTCEQLKLIESGIEKFVINDSPNPGQQVECMVHHRDGFGPQIINRTEVQIHPFGVSVNVMRTCKQIEKECAKILYGENTYQFRTAYSHRREQLLRTTWRIPGFPYFAQLPSKATITKAVERLFDLDCYQPEFIATDPFIRFIAYIGQRNASLLRDIKFDGMFKSATVEYHHRSMELIEPNPYLGFGTILPTYTLIIGESCPKLRKLTLHQSNDLGRWSSDLQKPDDMRSEDIIDNIVKEAVLRLPSLRELQLGAYFNVPDAPGVLRDRDCRTEWGKSLQWMKFVDERKRDQQPQVDIQNNILIDRTGVRSGSGNRYKDSVEHVRRGRYGTSNCNWSFTRCPTQAASSHTGELYRFGQNERDQYGFLPNTTDRAWRCQDAHGGIRDPIGNILNIAVKIDPRGAPHTISPSKLEMVCRCTE